MIRLTWRNQLPCNSTEPRRRRKQRDVAASAAAGREGRDCPPTWNRNRARKKNAFIAVMRLTSVELRAEIKTLYAVYLCFVYIYTHTYIYTQRQAHILFRVHNETHKYRLFARDVLCLQQRSGRDDSYTIFMSRVLPARRRYAMEYCIDFRRRYEYNVCSKIIQLIARRALRAVPRRCTGNDVFTARNKSHRT